MTLLIEIVAGCAMMIVCSTLHALILARLIRSRRGAPPHGGPHPVRNNLRSIMAVFSVVSASHLLQIGLWAISFRLFAGIATFEEAIYFAMASYTTLGYGDVVLGTGLRVYGAMASITGILTIGLSTALLVAFFANALDLKR